MDHLGNIEGKWEKRWHPIRQEWVVYAAHRNSRPWSFEKKEKKAVDAPSYDPTCYLCPGNMRVSGVRNPDYTGVYIFENDHPVVGPNAPEIPLHRASAHDGLYITQKAEGIAKVVCYDPRHHVTLSDVHTEKVANVFFAWRDEMILFQKNPKIKNVLIFENKGEIVGVSNPHPHCQIYATDFNFNLIDRSLLTAFEYHQKKGRNLYADIIQAEQKDGLRVIAENQGAIAFVPFFARFAYEVYVFPKKRHATLATMSDSELFDFAQVYQMVTRKFDVNFDMSFPYIMTIIQAPVDDESYDQHHLHVTFLPPLRQPGLVKFLAGPETGTGTFMADTIPEEKALELIQTDISQFKSI